MTDVEAPYSDPYPIRLVFDEAPQCHVGLSPLHGEGLFAGRTFEPGDLVAQYGTSFLRWSQVPYRQIPHMPAIWSLLWFVGESEEIARIADRTSVFMRANHSSTPNTLWDPQGKTLRATRVILIGEEITYDYRLEVAPSWLGSHRPSWCM